MVFVSEKPSEKPRIENALIHFFKQTLSPSVQIKHNLWRHLSKASSFGIIAWDYYWVIKRTNFLLLLIFSLGKKGIAADHPVGAQGWPTFLTSVQIKGNKCVKVQNKNALFAKRTQNK